MKLTDHRLLKKMQMQGGPPGTHPQDGCGREAYAVGTSQRRASEPTPQMRLFPGASDFSVGAYYILRFAGIRD